MFMTMAHGWIELRLLQVILFAEKVLITLMSLNETLHKMRIDAKDEGKLFKFDLIF